MNNEVIRTYVRSAYDMQKLRIAMGNRVVANWKVKLGQLPGMSEEELEAKAKTLIEDLRIVHKRLADAMPKQVKNFKGDTLITEYAEFALVDQYFDLLGNEEQHFKKLDKILDGIPIFDTFLSKVRGIGPALAGVIISEIDPHKAPYPSCFISYAGLDAVSVWRKIPDTGAGPDHVGMDAMAAWDDVEFNEAHTMCSTASGTQYELVSQGRSRKAHHLVDREYEPRDWKEGQPLATKKSITFNPFLKTKLTGVLGSSFLKASRVLVNGENMSTARRAELAKSFGWNAKGENGKVKDPETSRVETLEVLRQNGYSVVFDNSPYQVAYAQYKARIRNMREHADKSDMHVHNMAVRYMIKRFLIDLYNAWRPLEGLPVAPTYEEAKLGMIHGSGTNHLRRVA